MTARVIGLDISTSATGLAMPDGTTRTIKPRAGADDPARRLSEILALIDPYLRLAKADLAVIEGYSLFGPRQHTLIRLAEVGGAVRARLFEHGVPYAEVEPKRLKKFATGSGDADKGRPDKPEMQAAARACGASVANGDEADAWWLHAMGRAALSSWDPPFRAGELFEVRHEILRAVSWPVKGAAA